MKPAYHAAKTGDVFAYGWQPISALAILVAASLWAAPCLATEDEPNDTLATATTSGLVGLGTVTFQVQLLGNGDWPQSDVDLYSFDIDAATPLPVSLTADVSAAGPELDAYLRLFDASGVELGNQDDRSLTDTDPRLQTLLVAAGIYYIGVSPPGNPHYDPAVGGSGSPSNAGTYDLTIATEPTAPPDSPFEPNDTVGSATFMGRRSFTVTGKFIGDGDYGRQDVDIYVLALTGPARIDVVVDSGLYESILDPVVRLRNCEDDIPEPTYVDPCLLGASGETHGGTNRAEASAGVLEAQDVYIMVSGSGNRRYNPGAGGSGEPGSVGYYDLTVTVTYYERDTLADEPNDSLAMPTHLPPFVAGRPDVIEVDGYVGDGPYAPFQGDRDVYEVTLIDETRLVTIDVEAEAIGSDLDPVIVLYDSFGTPVLFNDNRGVSVDTPLVLPLPCVFFTSEQPSAYVMVMGTKQRSPENPYMPWGDETIVPPYWLDDGPGSTGPYRLKLSVEDVDPCVGDPGDTLAMATDTGIVDEGVYACTYAQIGDGECADLKDDVDIWSVEVLHAPARVRAVVAACRPYPVPPLDRNAIRIFDAAGVELARVMACSSGDNIPNALDATVTTAGTYYVGTGTYCGGEFPHDDYDPHIPCSGYGSDEGSYDIAIMVMPETPRQTPPRAGRAASDMAPSQDDSSLFVTRLDAAAATIDLVDADSGSVTASLPVPESRLRASGGLAYNGSHIYYVGAGRYPRLYQLDATTGTILDDFILWVGSGFYSGAVMLGGELYLLDYHDRSIQVIDPVTQRFVRTLPLGWQHGISISGGLAALTGPDQLYVADAFNSRDVYEVDPQSGALTRTLASFANRPTALAGVGESALFVGDWESSTLEAVDRDGNPLGTLELSGPVSALAGDATIGFFPDFDRDRDVDLIDFASFQRCFRGSAGGVEPGCEPSDRNGDDRVDLSDFAAFPAACTGP